MGSFTLVEDSLSLMAQGSDTALLSSVPGRERIKIDAKENLSTWTREDLVAAVVSREENWGLAGDPDFYTLGILCSEHVLP